MTVEARAATTRVRPAVSAALNLKSGGVCLIVGAVGFAIGRLLHGDTPAVDAEAAVNFVQNRPIYPAVPIFARAAQLCLLQSGSSSCPASFLVSCCTGVLASVVAQLWLVMTGIVMLRRARVAAGPSS